MYYVYLYLYVIVNFLSTLFDTQILDDVCWLASHTYLLYIIKDKRNKNQNGIQEHTIISPAFLHKLAVKRNQNNKPSDKAIEQPICLRR